MVPKCANHFRPFDLASIAFNSLQKIILPQFMNYVNQTEDKMRVAYCKGAVCINAVLVLIHKLFTINQSEDIHIVPKST